MHHKRTILLIFSFLVLFVMFYISSAPYDSKNNLIHISQGRSINSISSELKDKDSIRSIFVFKIFITLFKDKNGIDAGDYLISKNSSVWSIAWQVSRGNHNILPVKVTLREGLNNEQMAEILSDKIVSFRKDVFLSSTLDKEGYLFPDTYFFFPLDETDEIINKLTNNFEIRTKKVKQEAVLKGKNFDDIIVMASILEGEANGKNDIKIISGILWKRISLGMPMQVDVDRDTYKVKGLPKYPLNNPGLASIEAALNPVSTSYLYYLHDKNGNVHFAKTFDEHKKNINNYLK